MKKFSKKKILLNLVKYVGGKGLYCDDVLESSDQGLKGVISKHINYNTSIAFELPICNRLVKFMSDEKLLFYCTTSSPVLFSYGNVKPVIIKEFKCDPTEIYYWKALSDHPSFMLVDVIMRGVHSSENICAKILLGLNIETTDKRIVDLDIREGHIRGKKIVTIDFCNMDIVYYITNVYRYTVDRLDDKLVVKLV
jgi:hypothetical protein